MSTAQEIFTIEEYSKRQFDYLDIINRMQEYSHQQTEFLREELEEWNELSKIGNVGKWKLMYEDYSKLINASDTASFWNEQFNIANAERNELKQKYTTLKHQADEMAKALESYNDYLTIKNNIGKNSSEANIALSDFVNIKNKALTNYKKEL